VAGRERPGNLPAHGDRHQLGFLLLILRIAGNLSLTRDFPELALSAFRPGFRVAQLRPKQLLLAPGDAESDQQSQDQGYDHGDTHASLIMQAEELGGGRSLLPRAEQSAEHEQTAEGPDTERTLPH